MTPIESLIIAGESGTYFTPSIDFDAETGECKIEGESYLENTFNFYEELGNWFVAYYASGGGKIHLQFKLTYFNTSSSRAILDLLMLVKNKKPDSANLRVSWLYPDPDEGEVYIEGEDLESDTGIPFEYVKYAAN